MNPQIAYGEDVIARLVYAAKGPGEAARMQTLLTDGLSQLAADACAEIGALPTDIVDAVVVANTAIHHLFLRLPAQQLAAAPYVPSVRRAVDVKAREIGVRLAPGAYVHLLPNIAGYVGADHVAMLLATAVADRTDTTLAIDIGTNTEMCLTHRGQMASLSCASGPAFEAPTSSSACAPRRVRSSASGSSTARPSIRRSATSRRWVCAARGYWTPSHLRRAGLLDTRGRLAGAQVREAEGGGDVEFVIAPAPEAGNGRAITVGQRDIRELQLAKGGDPLRHRDAAAGCRHRRH